MNTRIARNDGFRQANAFRRKIAQFLSTFGHHSQCPRSNELASPSDMFLTASMDSACVRKDFQSAFILDLAKLLDELEEQTLRVPQRPQLPPQAACTSPARTRSILSMRMLGFTGLARKRMPPRTIKPLPASSVETRDVKKRIGTPHKTESA